MIDPQDGVLDRIGRHSAATLHEAAGRIGALPARIKPLDPSMKLVGRAMTVAAAPHDNLWIHRAIDRMRPNRVLVVSVGGAYESGYVGEIIIHAMRRREAHGLVIDGCVRDYAELLQIGMPVFARGLAIRGTDKTRDAPGGIGGTIRIGEVPIAEGDIVVGDADGVVVLPADRAEIIAAAADERVEKERQIIAAIASGTSTLDLYGFR